MDIPWIISKTYLFGPILLLGGGMVVNLLQARVHRKTENFCVATELALSSFGSLLGTVAGLAGRIDASLVVKLFGIALFDLVILAVVILLHKSLAHKRGRPRYRFFGLVIVANLFGLVALSSTLYTLKLGLT